jgi:transcription initiation factor TFIIB
MNMSKQKLQDLIKSFSTTLELKENTILKAEEISRRAEENYLVSGKKTEGSAAAVIYIAGILEDDRRSQKEIAQVASVPESTIRNRYVTIVRELKIKKK